MKATLLLIVGAALVKLWPTGENVERMPNYASKSQQALKFAKANNMDSTVCFLIDMSVHSGKKRMAILDMQKDSIINEMIVTHGSAGAKGLKWSGPNSPVFSNIPSSHSSSLGKYKIGKRGWSNWGIHVNYKLHGLESTNNNAFKRVVVLHSWTAVNQEECYPSAAPYSWGCPAVSDEDMRYLDALLKKKKDVLMWIYVN